ncbi:MAG: hypothetical protein V7635_490 [Arthrobacter sp.]
MHSGVGKSLLRVASPPGNESFDSRPVPAAMQRPLWEAATARFLVPLEISSLAPTVTGVIGSRRIGDTRVCQLSATPHTGRRTSLLASGTGSGCYKIALSLGGRVMVEQHGRRALLRRGEMAVYDTSDEYAVGSEMPFGLMIILVPHDTLGLSRERIAAIAATRLEGENADQVRRRLLALASKGDETAVADAMAALRAAVTAQPRTRFGTPMPAPALADKVRELVAEKFADPGLGPEYLAGVLGVSRRHLYAACADELGPLAAYIRVQRLERSRRLLDSRSEDESTVAEIALECGFADPAHFSRVFRGAYGVPPTKFRRGARATASPGRAVLAAP